MCRFGVPYNDIREMRIDKFIKYSREMVYILEKSGEYKEGTYDTMMKDERTRNKDIVDSFRSLFKK